MKSIATVLKKVNFQSDNFAIFETNVGYCVKGDITGQNANDLIGIKVMLNGEWEEHKKFGRQFSFKSLIVHEDPIFFFLHKTVKLSEGISKQLADSYGDKIGYVIENKPNQLLIFKGITKSKLPEIISKWKESKHLIDLTKLLSPAGLTAHAIKRVYDEFGYDAIDIIKENPYALCNVDGIGFKKADQVAIILGYAVDSPDRMAACTRFALQSKMDRDGHSAVPASQIVPFMQSILSGDNDDVSDTSLCLGGINDLLKSGEIAFVGGDNGLSINERIENDELISTSKLIAMEKNILRTVQNNKERGPVVNDIDAWISSFENRTNKKFGDEQKEAIRLANKMPTVFSISGYAGTGKTTVSKAVLELIGTQFSRDEIACCALAGIAANRVRMQSGFNSSTIHSLLKYDGRTRRFYHTENNKLPYKLILLDEGSMPDTAMMDALFKAIDFDRTTLIILGDPAQLPPVGAGQPYADLLKLNLIPNVTLTKIYRQSDDKMITSLAADVRAGQIPEVNVEFDDFKFHDHSILSIKQLKVNHSDAEVALMRDKNTDDIKNTISNLVASHSSEMARMLSSGDHWGYITKMQVAAPMHKGPLGVYELNNLVQSVLNPNPSAKMIVGKRIYGLGDKVVHLRNNNMDVVPFHGDLKNIDFNNEQNVRVFNGQQGIVIDASNDNIKVLYPVEKYIASYTHTSINEGYLDLSYALTVHKTQGSEYQSVILPMTTAYYGMLNPKLMYTAMTRAKERLDIVGQKNAFKIACQKSNDYERVTCISFWNSEPTKNNIELNSGALMNEQYEEKENSFSLKKRKKFF